MGLRITEEQIMFSWEATCKRKAVKLMVDSLAIGEHDDYVRAMAALTGGETVLGHAAEGILPYDVIKGVGRRLAPPGNVPYFQRTTNLHRQCATSSRKTLLKRCLTGYETSLTNNNPCNAYL